MGQEDIPEVYRSLLQCLDFKHKLNTLVHISIEGFFSSMENNRVSNQKRYEDFHSLLQKALRRMSLFLICSGLSKLEFTPTCE